MSVLACDRNGCNNIMCDRYSHKHGYICGECFQELCDMGVGADIEEFMRSDKKYKDVGAERRYFESIFPDRN